VNIPDPTSVRSIVVLRLRAFGDTLLTTPTLRGLKKAYPHATLSVVMEPAMAQVLKGLPYVDEVILFDRLAHKKKGPWGELKATIAFWRELRARRFDLAVDVLGTPRTAAMALASGAPTRVGFAFRGRRWAYTLVHRPAAAPKYIADYTADVLRELGFEPDSLDLDFTVGADAQREMDAWLTARGFAPKGLAPVLVQGAGGWPLKCYPRHKMAKAAGLSATGGRGPVFLWGPGEKPMAEEMARIAGPDAVVAPETDFERMGALLKRADCLLTNDNATKHLAVACGCPSVTIFGPTSDVAWHPLGDRKHVALREKLNCAPCEAFTCARGDWACMERIPAERVAETVIRLRRGRT
jgi:ADP-heptose:LPS heptosyltransferase